MTDDRRQSVLWLTNFAPPYRRPVWQELGQHVDLTIALTDHAESKDGSVRPQDWFAPPAHDSAYTMVSLVGPSSGEVATATLKVLIQDADAIVLGGWERPIYWRALAHARHRRLHTVGFYESTVASQRFKAGPVAMARRRFFRSLDAIVTPGDAATEAVLEMGVSEARVHTGFNAVDVRWIHEHATAARAASPANINGHRYVYVGQMIPRKNLGTLIRAFSAIAHSEDELLIVGTGSERPALEALSSSMGQKGRITFQDTVAYSELPALLATQHTLVLSSLEEVWGLVVNEGLAAGLHAVVSRNCGVISSIESMKGVYPCRPDDLGLKQALQASKAQWSGWVPSPEILTRTPERFADVFREALRSPFPSSAEASCKARVGVVQPYIPQYRMAFFDQLASELIARDIQLQVLAPSAPDHTQRLRRDEMQCHRDWHVPTRRRSVQVHRLRLSYYGSLRRISTSSTVVVPAAATCIDTWLALILRPHYRYRLLVWGHIANYVKKPNRLDQFLERILLRRADAVLAYTDGGKRYALRQGLPPQRVLAVRNTIDTTSLERARDRLRQSEIASFQRRLNLVGRKCFLYLGGIDSDKGIDFLARSLEILRARRSTVCILIGGEGKALDLLQPAIHHAQAIHLGYISNHEKAVAAACSEAIVMPGRIGLVAVDALILRKPIIARAGYALHAPEIEYLDPGETVYPVAGDELGFATCLDTFVSDDTPRTDSYPRLPDMVANFLSVLVDS